MADSHALSSFPILTIYKSLYKLSSKADTSLDWTGELVRVNRTLSLNNNISDQTIEALTALPESILIKVEKDHHCDFWAIAPSHLEIDSKFLDQINLCANQLAHTLDHPFKVRTELPKLVIYKYGDYSNGLHNSRSIMSLIVDISLERKRNGGYLMIGKSVCGPPSNSQLHCTLFYSDTSYEISSINRSSRVSLIFDIIDTDEPIPEILDKFRPRTLDIYSYLKDYLKGDKTMSLFAGHTYRQLPELDPVLGLSKKLESLLPEAIVEQVSYLLSGYRLKGIDRIVSLLLQELGIDIQMRFLKLFDTVELELSLRVPPRATG